MSKFQELWAPCPNVLNTSISTILKFCIDQSNQNMYPKM